MHDDLVAAIAGAFPEIKETLEQLVRIPSVSSGGFDPAPVRESAEAVATVLRQRGFAAVSLLEHEKAHPAVFGEIAGPNEAPTVLLYAHHDVQPPGDESAWLSPPFEPVEREGRLFGRGVADDKAGIAVHLGAIAAFGGRPPVSVKVLIEGEEEIGSLHLEDFLTEHAHLLDADVIVIADSGNWRRGLPSFTTSLRGLVECKVRLRTLETGVHSGMYGGALPDALSAMVRMLATLIDDEGNVAIEGIASSETDPLDLTPDELRREADALSGTELIGNGTLTSRLWTKPAVSVVGMDAPPVDRAINELVANARAKVSLRVPPGTSGQEAATALVAHLKANVPWGAEIEIELGSASEPVMIETSGSGYEAFREGMRWAWGVEPVNIGVGGSIPIVSAFMELYPDATILLTGVSDPATRPHSPNESVDLVELERGMIAEAIALRILAG